MTKAKKTYALLLGSIILLIAAVCLLIYVTYGWFINQKKMTTVTWIKTPIILTIGAGNHHDIQYLDMGDIDVNSGHSADYVFCVYGEPIDIYSLQLAHTTNIAFSYDVYRANIASASDDKAVSFVYMSNGEQMTENFSRADAEPVISAKPITEMQEDEIKRHQSHSLSYGDEKGRNPVETKYVQSNAEPLYWLACEEGGNAMKPRNVDKKEDGSFYFCDYYILHVSWKDGAVANDKETDIVYLTASR